MVQWLQGVGMIMFSVDSARLFTATAKRQLAAALEASAFASRILKVRIPSLTLYRQLSSFILSIIHMY
jgi:hypothetical protein